MNRQHAGSDEALVCAILIAPVFLSVGTLWLMKLRVKFLRAGVGKVFMLGASALQDAVDREGDEPTSLFSKDVSMFSDKPSFIRKTSHNLSCARGK